MASKQKKAHHTKKHTKRSPAQPSSPLSSASREEDRALIRAALRGNQAAYQRLMKKYSLSLSNLIFRLIHDKREVEDLTQEAFVKAFASLKNFNEEFAFSTWLYKIARNNTIRSEERRVGKECRL